MNFSKNTYVYLLSNILSAAIPFTLLPILTRYLSPGEYGQVAMFQTMLIGISAFIGLNTVGAANRKFYDDNLNLNDFRSFNGSCLQILIFTLSVSAIVLMVSNSFLAKFLSIPSEWLYLALLVSSCTFLINLRLGQWQVRKSAKNYGLLQVGNSLVNIILTLIFIVFYANGAQGRIDALVYTGIVSATIAILLLYKDKLISLKGINKNHIKDALRFGAPLVPHVFGAFLLTTSDRFVINNKLGLSEAGVYMVAVQISMSISILFDAINKAYVPWLFEKLKLNDGNEKKIIVKNTYLYFIFLIFLAALSFLIGPLIVTLVVGDEYRRAGSVIGWLCLGQIFGGMYLMVTNYIFFAKKTGLLSLVTISSGLLNLLTMLVLINYLGVQGAAIAFALSKMVQFLLTWWLASKSIPMPWGTIFEFR